MQPGVSQGLTPFTPASTCYGCYGCYGCYWPIGAPLLHLLLLLTLRCACCGAKPSTP